MKTAVTNIEPRKTQDVWDSLREPLFFFILKRVGNEDISKDVLQEVFIKIHLNLDKLRNPEKVNAWAFQIARNQVAEYFNKSRNHVTLNELDEEHFSEDFTHGEIEFCCFENLIDELPKKYSEVLTLINVEGKKQKEAASELHLSLPNIKSRVHRAKEMLKKKFIDCCKFSLNEKGLLVGEQNCHKCSCSS